MKLLLVEDWRSHIYGEPFLRRFQELGVPVEAFREYGYFERSAPAMLPARARRAWAVAQEKLHLGPAMARLNRDLVARVREARPDVVFVFRGDKIWPGTIQRLRDLGVYVICWQNDDPLSSRYPKYFWRHFVRSIPLYDRIFAYRHSNAEAFRRLGCPRVGLLRSFYLRELDHPVADVGDSPYRCEVSFIGHWEPDGRDAYVRALLDRQDIDFRLWGTLWERSRVSGALRARFGTIRPVYREAYNLAINSCAIALVFLSGLNNDTYTRRCFEITAAGTFMLAPYTDDLASLFAPGVEADYFRDPGEMIEKIRFYLSHPDERERIARAGYERVMRDGHEVLDRAKQVLAALQEDGVAARA